GRQPWRIIAFSIQIADAFRRQAASKDLVAALIQLQRQHVPESRVTALGIGEARRTFAAPGGNATFSHAKHLAHDKRASSIELGPDRERMVSSTAAACARSVP